MSENQLEEKLDKLTSYAESQVRLLETQNRAWEKCLQLLDELNTILVKKWQTQDLLLEEHPTVRGPTSTTTTVGQAQQPKPGMIVPDLLSLLPIHDHKVSNPYR